MNELCYIPKPLEFESPRSLLMRMAHYNGFGTVRTMCAYFGVRPRRWVGLLDKDSLLLKLIENEQVIFAEYLRNSFYTVASGNAHFIKAGGVSLPRGACPDYFLYCPKCVEIAQSLVFHDIPNIEMCITHGVELVTQCPNCQISQHWYEAQLFRCKCGFERSTANRVARNFIPSVLDPFQFPSIVEEVRCKYISAKICAALWESRRHANNQDYCDLPIQVIDYIETTLTKQVAQYPGFIKSLHLAPWSQGGSATIFWLADRALEKIYVEGQSCHSKDCCRLAKVDRKSALKAVFGDTKVSAEAVWKYGLDGWPAKQSTLHCTERSLCQVIRDAHKEYCPNVNPLSDNSNGMTKDEAAKLLKCTLAAVDGLLRIGWLTPFNRIVQSQLCIQDVIDRNSVEQFANQFIFLDELKVTLNAPESIYAKLIQAPSAKAIYSSLDAIFLHRAGTLTELGRFKSSTDIVE